MTLTMLTFVRKPVVKASAQFGGVHTAACVCRLVSVVHIRNLGFGLFAFSHPCDSRYHEPAKQSLVATCAAGWTS